MIASIRRIANTLFVLSIAMLCLTTLSNVFVGCAVLHSCAASLVGITDVSGIQPNFDIAQTTAVSLAGDTGEVMQQIGLLMLVVAVALILVMEMFELRYLRALFKNSRRLRA